ncbi:MAG TPA: polymer-forming cytoskeletal protein [Erysipelotrichaceae bacterium]|jgi:cytoskeletal protein CcmA (bactofilin family)|nr:polymer-forming cytoskeletal protein [Erysipelotrichia bacterium]HPX32598.1 polymer-forming cytoskeletal protein [Erysipelotrichaceae bacterium]HQA85221.1 polymer-forming cytoskeletal protein [Erysipelotrichaceae bacterium]
MNEKELFQSVNFESPFQSDNRNKANNDDELTIIGSSTVIEGKQDSKIICGGNIEIMGQVKGLVDVAGSAEIYGTIDGLVNAEQLTVEEGSKINGDINCRTTLSINGADIVGNIKAKNAYINASIKGNIEATNDLKIANSSVIEGNIATGSISIESGAVLAGNLLVKK